MLGEPHIVDLVPVLVERLIPAQLMLEYSYVINSYKWK